jgi:molybdopterin-guanine dinucleotide biosynthesis protein A
LGLDVPKALVVRAGSSLLDRARHALAGACDEVVVVAPSDLALPIPAAERVNDAIDGAGPLSALVAGLESRDFERALVLAVDLPGLDSPRLLRLLSAHRDGIATVPAPEGRLQPLAAVYAPAAAPPLRRALEGGARALTPQVRSLGPRVLDDPALVALGLAASDFADLDTPADLERWGGAGPGAGRVA